MQAVFGVRYIFSLFILEQYIIFNFVDSVPEVNDTNIKTAESAIRTTANGLFYTFGLRKIQQNPRLHHFAVVHNYFISNTLQSDDELKEIVKLTRVDKSSKTNNDTNFIALINEILNEDNVLKLQNIMLGDNTNGYDLESEMVKLDFLKNYHAKQLNISNQAIVNKKSYSSKWKNITKTEKEENNSIDRIPFWNEEDDKIPERRIFNGKKTKIKKFPFMASIQTFGKFQCAGSIIKSDLVITAASCLQLAWNNRFYRENPTFLSVRVGSSFYEVGGDTIDVLEIYFHPNYDPKTLTHNIAIMRLNRKIKMKRRRVQKIEIAKTFGNDVATILVVGWGAYTTGNRLMGPWNNKIRSSGLDIFLLEECQDIYSKKYVTQRNFCAGFLSKGGGACNRDIGGPGIISGQLAGVISFGAPQCGRPGAPTVFTKLTYYTDWIEEIMEMEVPWLFQRTTRKPITYLNFVNDQNNKSNEVTERLSMEPITTQHPDIFLHNTVGALVNDEKMKPTGISPDKINGSLEQLNSALQYQIEEENGIIEKEKKSKIANNSMESDTEYVRNGYPTTVMDYMEDSDLENDNKSDTNEPSPKISKKIPIKRLQNKNLAHIDNPIHTHSKMLTVQNQVSEEYPLPTIHYTPTHKKTNRRLKLTSKQSHKHYTSNIQTSQSEENARPATLISPKILSENVVNTRMVSKQFEDLPKTQRPYRTVFTENPTNIKYEEYHNASTQEKEEAAYLQLPVEAQQSITTSKIVQDDFVMAYKQVLSKAEVEDKIADLLVNELHLSNELLRASPKKVDDLEQKLVDHKSVTSKQIAHFSKNPTKQRDLKQAQRKEMHEYVPYHYSQYGEKILLNEEKNLSLNAIHKNSLKNENPLKVTYKTKPLNWPFLKSESENSEVDSQKDSEQINSEANNESPKEIYGEHNPDQHIKSEENTNSVNSELSDGNTEKYEANSVFIKQTNTINQENPARTQRGINLYNHVDSKLIDEISNLVNLGSLNEVQKQTDPIVSAENTNTMLQKLSTQSKYTNFQEKTKYRDQTNKDVQQTADNSITLTQSQLYNLARALLLQFQEHDSQAKEETKSDEHRILIDDQEIMHPEMKAKLNDEDKLPHKQIHGTKYTQNKLNKVLIEKALQSLTLSSENEQDASSYMETLKDSNILKPKVSSYDTDKPVQDKKLEVSKVSNEIDSEMATLLKNKIDKAMLSLLYPLDGTGSENIPLKQSIERNKSISLDNGSISSDGSSSNENTTDSMEVSNYEDDIKNTKQGRIQETSWTFEPINEKNNNEVKLETVIQNQEISYNISDPLYRVQNTNIPEKSNFKHISNVTFNLESGRRAMNAITFNSNSRPKESAEDNTTEVSTKLDSKEAEAYKQNILDYINI